MDVKTGSFQKPPRSDVLRIFFKCQPQDGAQRFLTVLVNYRVSADYKALLVFLRTILRLGAQNNLSLQLLLILKEQTKMKKLVILLLTGSLLMACNPQENPNSTDPSTDGTTGTFTDTRDGVSYTYKTVTIGSQVWMAENLKYLPQLDKNANEIAPGYYILDFTGTEIAAAKLKTYRSNKMKKGIVVYEEVGVYYNYPAAQTACPQGWRLPTKADWDVLVNYLGGNEEAGRKMMLKDEDIWYNPVEGATNSSGFNGRMTSYLFTTNMIAASFGDNVHWWSSTPGDGGKYHVLSISKSSLNIFDSEFDRDRGIPVRCVKN